MRFSKPDRALPSVHFFIASTLAVLALGLLAGCAFLIPDNPSSPRYNDVLGRRHAPELNPASAHGAAPQPGAQLQPQHAAPVVQQMAQAPQQQPAHPSASAFPPVDESTRMQAQQQMAQQSAPHKSFWSKMAFWREDAPSANTASMPAANARQVPPENSTPDTGGGYPMLSQVPERPPLSGPDAASVRLAAVKNQLEQDRAASGQSSARLAVDARNEPSLLSQLPEGAAPMPVPVSVAPVAPPVAASAAWSAPSASGGYIAMPPPPAPLMAAAPPSAPPPVAMSPAPAPVPQPVMQVTSVPPPVSLEPIVLHPPGTPAPAPAPALAQPFRAPPLATVAATTPSSMPKAIAGGFDPMAGSANTAQAFGSQAASDGYLPPSRYSQRRSGI